jgi:hypothetical protein
MVMTFAGNETILHIFETVAQANSLNADRSDALKPLAQNISKALDDCAWPKDPCCKPICAVCARAYRIHFFEQVRDIAGKFERNAQIATIYLGAIELGSLLKVKIASAHKKLRRRLNTSGFGSAILIGGTEVAWIQDSKHWALHVHLLAIGVPTDAWDRLTASFKKDTPPFPVKVQDLEDPGEQLSYLTKFFTYHRPGKRNASGQALAVPLPQRRLAELALWWDAYRFEDFAFLHNARRIHSRIHVS